MAGNLTLPPTRDAYTGKDGKPTAAFFDSLSKSQRAVNTLSRIPIIPSVDDADSIPSGAEGALIFSDQGVPAPYVSRLNEPSHSGKIYRDGQWFELIRNDGCYITDFGGKNNLAYEGSPYFDHSFDNTPALNAANEYCVVKQKSIIRIPAGVYECKSKPDPFPVGINLVGNGFSSSQIYGGSCLMRSYSEWGTLGYVPDFSGGKTPADNVALMSSGQRADAIKQPFLHWDGTGLGANTTGGGARDLHIIIGDSQVLGTAILIDAPLGSPTVQSNRPGYMTFMNLQIAGNSGGFWGNNIVVDGSKLFLTNGQGLRDTVWINIWFNSWYNEGVGMTLNNATHCKMIGVTASPGGFSGPNYDALKITGIVDPNGADAYPQENFDTSDMQASGIEMFGRTTLDRMRRCSLMGRFQLLTITGNCKDTTIIPTMEKGVSSVTYSGTSRASLYAQGTFIYDGLEGTQFGDSTNGGEFMPGGRIKKWMNVTGIDTSWGTYSWSSFLGANDVPFTSTPTLVSISTGSGALTTPGYDNITAGTIDLRAQAASQTVRVVMEGPY